MIRAQGLLRRRLCFTEQELEALIDEFSDYACEDITDLLQQKLDASLSDELKLEIAYVIRSVIEELPHEKPSPALQLRNAAMETLGVTDSTIVKELVLARYGTPR